MMYELPTSVEVGGTEYEVRSDYRAILDICAALSDPDLNDNDRGEIVLEIFYPGLDEISPADYNEAIQKCFWFVRCGEDEPRGKTPKLMDWGKDFRLLVNPVNRVIGAEIRSVKYLHWWTFIGAYLEIGDCFFSQIIGIRNKKMLGRSLDKSEQEFYRKNRNAIDLKTSYTETENELLKQWGIK